MNPELVRRHRALNRIQTILLLAAMAGLLAMVGWLFAGAAGLAWSLVMVLAIASLGPVFSSRLILSMYRARELSPQELPRLHRVVAELARRAELARVPRLYYVASPVLNAFALGGPAHSSIVVSDGMLRKFGPRELTGVLAHEISHIRNNDISVMGLADLFSRVTGVLSTAGQLLLLFNLPLILFSDYWINWWAILVLIAAPGMSALIQLALSRTREFDADIGAAELTGDPEGLASALDKIERYRNNILEQLVMPGKGVPEPSILRTHPHTRDRLARLRSLKPSPPAGPLHARDEFEAAFDRPPPAPPRWRSMGMWY